MSRSSPTGLKLFQLSFLHQQDSPAAVALAILLAELVESENEPCSYLTVYFKLLRVLVSKRYLASITFVTDF